MQGLQFSAAENLGKYQTRSPPTEAPNAGGGRLSAGAEAEYWRLSTRSVVTLVYRTERPPDLFAACCRDAARCAGLSAVADLCFKTFVLLSPSSLI